MLPTKKQNTIWLFHESKGLTANYRPKVSDERMACDQHEYSAAIS